MAFDLTALSAYTEEKSEEIIGKVIAGGRTMRLFDLQTGYKGPQAINRLDTDAVFQDGSSCGFNSSGTTALTQRILTPGHIKIQESLCVRDLNAYWTRYKVKPGSTDDTFDFLDDYTGIKNKKINAANAKALWQGDTTSGDANLARFDGWLKIIDAATGVIDGNTGSETSITVSNVIAIVKAMYMATPDALLDAYELVDDKGDSISDVAIMSGADTFRLYISALIDANLYHYDGNPLNLEIVIPGTNVKLIGLPELSGTDRLIGGRIGSEGGFVVGTDLEHEEEKFKLWYSDDDDLVKYSVHYKLGAQIKWPEEIVEFTLTA